MTRIATALTTVRDRWGPQAVAFNRGTGSGTALREAEPWLERLANHFGSPNYVTTAYLCNWPRDGASLLTLGVEPLPKPDAAASGCIVLWGHNPNATLLSLARDVAAARARGARLVVVDPRRVGLANKADQVLQVRPGTDGALALALIHVLIEHGWYDDAFVREWTNAPHLVRDDDGRLLRVEDVAPAPGAPGRWPLALGRSGRLVPIAPPSHADGRPREDLQIHGSTLVDVRGGGRIRCRPVFEILAEEAARCAPAVAATITGVPERAIRDTARLMAENRPVSHFVWNGLVQHTNATQACRAIEILFALIGDFDAPGGNVVRLQPLTGAIAAHEALPADAAATRLGQRDRPLGPAAVGHVSAPDLYTSILSRAPDRVRALFALGGNLLMANGEPYRGREALQGLEFFAQAELFLTPTSNYADIVLPAADFLESEALYPAAGGTVQRRPRVVEPLHDRRADVDIVFDLACRVGLAEPFAGGDVAQAYDRVLAPFGLSWNGLRDHPHGISLDPDVTYRKYAAAGDGGLPAGFATPSGRVELYSDRLADQGQSPVPRYEEPAQSPLGTPDLAREYPLVLTNAKRAQYLHTQHRGIARLRKAVPDPLAEIHPDTAAEFGIEDGTWLLIETPHGAARARAKVTGAIIAGVVCANHGWWEACEELGLPALDPFGPRGANVNLLVSNRARDPISGSVPHRSSLCRIRPAPDDTRNGGA